MKTDYFNDAFDGFDPGADQDAAMKFCLNAVLMDRRFADLQVLLSDDAEVGGMAGEPGWVIEHRHADEIAGDADWPAWSRFRAFVDPDNYVLGYPECFCNQAAFEKLLAAAIRAYCNRHPGRQQEVAPIVQILSRSSFLSE